MNSIGDVIRIYEDYIDNVKVLVVEDIKEDITEDNKKEDNKKEEQEDNKKEDKIINIEDKEDKIINIEEENSILFYATQKTEGFEVYNENNIKKKKKNNRSVAMALSTIVMVGTVCIAQFM